MGLDDQNMPCEAGNRCQGFYSIVAMIKDTQVKDDIKLTDRLYGQVRDIDLARIHIGAKRGACKVECLAAANLRMRPTVRVRREDARRATAFCFEAEKAIPSPDIEHRAPAQIDAIENETRFTGAI